jgi:hypothetical protein
MVPKLGAGVATDVPAVENMAATAARTDDATRV